MRDTNRERGSALIVITVLVVVLAGLAGAFLATTAATQKTTLMTEDEVLSRQASEAGLDKARRLLYEVREVGGTWSDSLNSCSSYFQMSGFQVPGKSTTTTTSPNSSPTGGTSSYESYMLASAPTSDEDTRTGVSPYQFYGHNFTHGDTIYNVLVADDDDGDSDTTRDTNNQVVVFTTVAAPANPPPGVARRVLGTTRTVVYYEPPNFAPVHAISVGGGLILGGNPTINGTLGSVHANGDFTFQGSPSVSVQASASGTLTRVGGAPVPPGGLNSNVAKTPLPKIDPDKYLSKAQYYLDNDGKVYDNTTSPKTLIATGSWNGFSFASGQWSRTASSPVPPPATLYFNADVKITGGGSDATPWKTTLLIKGSIDISGNPRLVPFEKNVTIVALGDVKLRGNASAQPGVNGLIATHEQIDISGTPKFTGAVVAEDAVDNYNLVSSVNQVGYTGEMFDSIMGNFTLTYNGGMETFLTAGGVSVKVRSWDKYK